MVESKRQRENRKTAEARKSPLVEKTPDVGLGEKSTRKTPKRKRKARKY